MVTTKPIVAGDQIVSSNSPLQPPIELICHSGIHTENFPIPNCFGGMATLTCLIYQVACKVIQET